jgi:hypothetical protein
MFTLTHIHLLINHLPIIGSLIGGLVLAHGMGTKSFQTNIAAYYILILSAIGATIAYLTGEPAEKLFKFSVLNYQDKLIHNHEEFATYALTSFIILGVVSLIALYAIYQKISYANLLAKILMALCIMSFLLVARTGYLGGLIRHTELENNSPFNHESGTEKD